MNIELLKYLSGIIVGIIFTKMYFWIKDSSDGEE